MVRHRRIYLLLIIVALPTVLKAEGQEGLVYILDGFTLLVALSVWAILFFVILAVLKYFRNTDNGLKQKFLVGAICLLFAVFQFTMTKSDPYPYEGPIDEFIHRDKIREWKIKDSLEVLGGKPDSTIEETIASVDTSKIGIYIWLHGQSIFVRKPTPELRSQRQNDSLTMSIVRKWKK